jgi:hypothetical protein
MAKNYISFMVLCKTNWSIYPERRLIYIFRAGGQGRNLKEVSQHCCWNIVHIQIGYHSFGYSETSGWRKTIQAILWRIWVQSLEI